MSEKYFVLADGRTLAYSDAGNPSSACLVISFHGALGVGNAPDRLNSTLTDNDVHLVAPTLAGWGKSSSKPKHLSFNISLVSDISALIQHLHPNDLDLKIFVMGGSYGTVAAQMLYGAPFDIFPYGRHLVGCMVLGPFSPPKFHKDFATTMTTANYIAVGPPSQYIPFHLVQRLGALVMSGSTKDVGRAEAFIRKILFDKMKTEERAAYAKWREDNSKEEGQLERELAQVVVRSVAERWDGFYEISDVLHSDWGFDPHDLDDEHHEGRPIFIVAAEGDTMSPDAMAKWLAANYKNAHYRSITGGHLAGLFHLDDLWKEFFQLCDR